MLKIKLLTLFLIFSLSIIYAQTTPLFPFRKANLWGYLNEQGKEAIPAQFYVANPYVEGVAAVRAKKGWGYIDTKGNFVILPKYDLAFNFENGIAKVYLNEKGFFIDKKGEILLQHPFKDIANFGNHTFALVKSFSNKYGLVDKKGNLIIDTVFKKIEPNKGGFMIITGFHHDPYNEKKPVYEMGIMDSLGNWKVKFGVYNIIRQNERNHFLAAALPLDSIYQKRVNIDYEGNQISDNYRWRPSKPLPRKEIEVFQKDSTDGKKYTIAQNRAGKTLFSDTNWTDHTYFSHNRAFVKGKNGKWFLINTKGERVGTDLFEGVVRYSVNGDENLFENGIAFVRTPYAIGLIDTAGEWIVEPYEFEATKYGTFERIGNYLRIKENNKYGFWNPLKAVLVPPQFETIQMNALENTLFLVDFELENMPYWVNWKWKMKYMNSLGEIAWEEDSILRKGGIWNVDFIPYKYFQVEEESPKKIESFSTTGQGNYPIIPKETGKLYCYLALEEQCLWKNTFKGMKAYILNLTEDTISFPVQDYMLNFTFQAKNSKGEWQDLEYLPSSWCGNSYYDLELKPKEYWECCLPVYEGSTPAKIRGKLIYYGEGKTREERTKIIYSNEIEVSINGTQFWNEFRYGKKTWQFRFEGLE